MMMPDVIDESEGSESALDPYETDCYSSACEDDVESDDDDAESGDVGERSPEHSTSMDFCDPGNARTSPSPEVPDDLEEYSYGFKGSRVGEIESERVNVRSLRQFKMNELDSVGPSGQTLDMKKEEDVGGLGDYFQYVLDEEEGCRDCQSSRGVRKAKLEAESFLESLKMDYEDDPKDRSYSGDHAHSVEAPVNRVVIERKRYLQNLPSFYYKGVKLESCSVQVTPIPDKILQHYGVTQVDQGHSRSRPQQQQQKIDLETLSKGLWPCNQCSFRTNYKRELKQHEWTHVLDKVLYKCSICGMKFDRAVSLSCHIGRKHRKDREKIEKKVTNELVHECPHCDYSTHERSSLRTHIRKHTGEKPYACPHCPYRARQHPHLKQHLYFHLDLKPYACTICDFRTRQKSHLTKHLLWVHSEEKPFKCSKCDYTAKSKKTRDFHFLSQHTDEKPWACKFCPFKTAHNNSYNAHVKAHKEKLDSPCPECSWSSKHSRSLSRHILQCHPDSKLIVSCHVCGYRTSDKNILENHLKTKHNITKVRERHPDCATSSSQNVL